MFTLNYHLHHEAFPHMDCVLVTPEQGSVLTQPYPRMHIGDVTIFPTDEQIQQIHDVLGAYLASRVVSQRDAVESAGGGEWSSANRTYNRLVRVVLATTTGGTPGYDRLDLITALCREFSWDVEQFRQTVKVAEAKLSAPTTEAASTSPGGQAR